MYLLYICGIFACRMPVAPCPAAAAAPVRVASYKGGYELSQDDHYWCQEDSLEREQAAVMLRRSSMVGRSCKQYDKDTCDDG